MPSRNILHVRGRRSKSRTGDGEVHRGAAAQKVSLKKKFGTTANFDLLRDPLFLDPMRTTSSFLKIE